MCYNDKENKEYNTTIDVHGDNVRAIMAVARSTVQQVLDYAVTESRRRKYIWAFRTMPMTGQLPYRRPQGQGRSKEILETMEIANQNGVQIRFDETAIGHFLTTCVKWNRT